METDGGLASWFAAKTTAAGPDIIYIKSFTSCKQNKIDGMAKVWANNRPTKPNYYIKSSSYSSALAYLAAISALVSAPPSPAPSPWSDL